ncbi:MAG: VOC family protein [Gammaproteobacteria bacterium]|nr:VOC family protein [Gammaproteobacteria bacterium]
MAYEIDPDATIHDSPATLLGVNHIGLSVRDLDAVLEFYQSASGFKLISRETVSNSPAADTLFGHENVEFEIAILEAPNMLFELIEFSHNRDIPVSKMPVQGPGMTHTCFQSPAHISGYEKFKLSGAEMLSRGDGPVDLLGQGVTYAYAYDPEGNMIELEQLDFDRLGGDTRNPDWIEQGLDMWMTQVALVTHDIERLTDFYAEIMGFNPYRTADIENRVTFDDATDIDNVALKVMFFRMASRSKSMEFWQYVSPETPEFSGNRDSTALGYSYSIEVGDIQAEYARMADLGVEFVSEPVLLGEFWQVYANDIDGNVFSLRQAADPDSPYSVPQLEQ